MADKQPLSSAQFMDRLMRRIAVAVFLISVCLAATVVMEYVSDPLADSIHTGTLVLAMVAVILVLPMFLRTILFKIRNRSSKFQPDSFVADAYRQAAERSFGLTFIFLALLDLWANNEPAPFSASIAINATLSLSLAFFSLSFFYLIRPVAGEEDDDFDTEQDA
ncbi:hypothetical protein DRQ32_01840 [bacterium]|nr:MAG: hypothetical protein DRQ32_01840 [bacterium]